MSPPLKFFEPDFLTKLVSIAQPEGGLIAMNMIVDDAANRRKIVQNLKTIPDCAKFASKMDEEKNEVIYLARGALEKKLDDKLDDTDNRVQCMKQVVNALKLPKALMMNKDRMKVSHHVEVMRRL